MENKHYALIFKALSDPIRLEILRTLGGEESVCVCHLVERFKISQSKLSYHLKLLLETGCITRTSQGTWNYYALNEEMLRSVLSEVLLNAILK